MGHRYDYEIELGDGSAPDRVVQMAGRNKRVLDIGAGPGSISRVLRDKFNCRVSAIETDADAIPRLESVCKTVYRIDLNDRSWPSGLSDAGSFDVVIAADVLEHLYDPWPALDRMKGLVARDGYLLISLPNAGYCGVLASLLDEDFGYRDAGLLDRTHIRFFGIRNMQELIEGAGLAITEAQFVVQHPENTEFAAVWAKTPPATRTNMLKNRFGLVYQVVMKCAQAQAETHGISLMDLLEEENGRGGTARPAGAQSPGLAVPGPGDTKVRGTDSPAPATDGSGEKVRLIAFYLPQFHPIPENDRWWGKGFTEWTNVTQAEPLFEGHYQPHLPADLGFYDLRMGEVRREQIAMARQYGIDGFCYHYYWFSGTRVLNRPLDDMLDDPESDMPFCLCWANENWTRRWDGVDHEVLLGQKHLPGDDLNFIRDVAPLFSDSRYIRLDGAPFLIVYQPQRLPDPLHTVRVWREYCETSGVGPIHLCAAFTNDVEDYSRFGFDSGVQFPPHNHYCRGMNEKINFYVPFSGLTVDYSALAESYLNRTYENGNVFRTVCPSWDQTARVGARAFHLLNGTPSNYEHWLDDSLGRTREDFPGAERFVFINAWNEWAEGCHLEPDQRFGRGFLEATFRASRGVSRRRTFEDVGLPAAPEPVSGTAARLGELRRELDAERRRFSELEAELAAERERLSAVYKDLAGKREEIAAIEEERAREREAPSTAHEGEDSKSESSGGKTPKA